MKSWKVLLIYGFILVFFSGCGENSYLLDASETILLESDRETAPSEKIEEAIVEPIPETWQSLDKYGALWYVPNAEIESGNISDVFDIAEQTYILREKYSFDELMHLSYGSQAFYIAKIDLADGTILQEAEVELGTLKNCQKQELENGIAVHSSWNGKILILDTDLQITAEYETEATKGNWYLGGDGSLLYDLPYEGDVTALDLITGEKQILLEDVRNCQVIGQNINCIFFYYVSPAQQVLQYLKLDLKTGQLSEIPFEEDLEYLQANDGLWLGKIVGKDYYIANDKTQVFRLCNWEYAVLSLLESQNYILQVTDQGRCLVIYDYQWNVISECMLPSEYWSGFIEIESNDLIWSERYGGYFFRCDEPGAGTSKILFWDIQVSSPTNNLGIYQTEHKEEVIGGASSAAELYEWAKGLSETYHLDIKIADQCKFNPNGQEFQRLVECEWVLDDDKISEGLSILEEALAQFPDDFMEALSYDRFKTIEIFLVGDLRYVLWYDTDKGENVTRKVDYNIMPAFRGLKYVMIVDIETASADTYQECFSYIREEKEKWYEKQWGIPKP